MICLTYVNHMWHF